MKNKTTVFSISKENKFICIDYLWEVKNEYGWFFSRICMKTTFNILFPNTFRFVQLGKDDISPSKETLSNLP